MSFSEEWDERYKESTHMSIWPWSDLVSYVYRYAKPAGSNLNVLELGCGAGANINLFKHLNVNYYAIDGSETIVKMLHEKFPEYNNSILIGDFTKDIPFEVQFDLIVDRASLTHNNTSAIIDSICLINKKLKPQGKFIGIDWFSTDHYCYKLGKTIDEYTKTNINESTFRGTGNVHFSDKAHLIELFKDFNIQIMEDKKIKTEIPEDNKSLAFWNFMAVKEK